MQDPARQLATITLTDADGEPRVLGELWTEQPAVLVFIRHFG